MRSRARALARERRGCSCSRITRRSVFTKTNYASQFSSVSTMGHDCSGRKWSWFDPDRNLQSRGRSFLGGEI